jgi:hypothetical protein
MILADLAINRIVNYDCKVCCKLNSTFTIVNCDCEEFIEHASGETLACILRGSTVDKR